MRRMKAEKRRVRSSRSRLKGRKTQHILMSIVLAGATLGAFLLVTGLRCANPVLKRVSILYLLVVGVVFCIWRALVAAAVEEENGG